MKNSHENTAGVARLKVGRSHALYVVCTLLLIGWIVTAIVLGLMGADMFHIGASAFLFGGLAIGWVITISALYRRNPRHVEDLLAEDGM